MLRRGKFFLAAICYDAYFIDLSKGYHFAATHLLHGLVLLRVQVIFKAREGRGVAQFPGSLRLLFILLYFLLVGLLEAEDCAFCLLQLYLLSAFRQ